MLHVIHLLIVMILLNVQLFLGDSFRSVVPFFPSFGVYNPLIIVATGAMIIPRW